MPAYLIAEVEVLDHKQFENYKQMAPPTIAAYGGKYLARGGPLETLEGEEISKRIVIVEFESSERAKEWWNSAEYREAKQLRQRSAKTTMILVEGQ
jgi:uncharacterized protein (DUF1330 family)